MSQIEKKTARLYIVADGLRERDPVGASLVVWAANWIASQRCGGCHAEYERGYANGTGAGYRRGIAEYGEGL